MKHAPKPADEAPRLVALREAHLLDTPPEPDFDDISALVAAIIGAPIALVSLVDDDRHFYKSRLGLDLVEMPRHLAFCAYTILGNDTFIVPDALLDPRFVESPLVTSGPLVRFYAGAPITTKDGHHVGALCVMDREPRVLLHAQRMALETLARQTAKLVDLRRAHAVLARHAHEAGEARQQRQMFMDLVENAPVAISVWQQEVDGGYTLQYANPSIKRIMDLVALDSRPGQRMHELLPHLVQKGDHGPLDHVLASKTPLVYEASPRIGQIELQLRVSLFPLPGETIGIAVEDIAERKALDRLKSEFVATVSHELRTPLTSIRGALGLLEGNVLGALSDEMSEIVTIARSSTDRLIRLINDILDLEKLESGKLEMKLAPLDVPALLAHTLGAMRAYADETNVSIVSRIEGRPHLVTDADRLEQVLTNLLSNALKFSPSGGRVELLVEAGSSEHVRFSVLDQGPGIAEAELGLLFGRFQQLDTGDERRRGGTGLGLAISKAIVEQLGGAIGVESVVGQGSTFWFELPSAGETQASRPPRVLIVDDDATFRATLEQHLAREGCEIETAGTLAEAERRLQASDFEAVLLDVCLPDGSGLSLLDTLRARASAKDMQVIVMSADAADPRAYTHRTLIDWLEKPFSAARLSSTLRWALRQKTRPRVLIAEDDADLRAVLARQLGALGVEVVEAANGEDALRLTRAARPDLIILEVGLPKKDGFELIATLRGEEARRTALVVYTDRDLSAEDRAALQLGVTRYLTKSRASGADLVLALRDLLRGLLKSASGQHPRVIPPAGAR